MSPRVVAVVVTWNRRELLEESLAALHAQTLPPVEIVVVDNASTDGMADLLDAAADGLDVVRLTRNTGGAGGFAAGIERALTHHPDLVWLLDDDTVPTATAAERLAAAWSTYEGARRPAVLASRVIWTDGRDHPMNTPRAKPGVSAAEARAAASVGCVPVRSASFVSIMCDADVVRERGLPVADYFLWNDDFEYSTVDPAAPGCTAPTAWWCTRPRRSGPPTPTRGSGSSSRSATRCGCSRAATA